MAPGPIQSDYWGFKAKSLSYNVLEEGELWKAAEVVAFRGLVQAG